MIKIYDLLFEQDTYTTSSTTSTQTNPEDFKQAITAAVEKTVAEPLKSIQAWMKQDIKTKPKIQTSSKAESTTSTTSTKPSGPSKAAGITTDTQQQAKNGKSLAADISKNLTSDQDFLNNLASKIKSSQS
jgi:hypothetical protein